MKTRIYTISLLTLALLVSCQNREEAPAIDKTFKLIAVQDNGAESKTVISGERSVYWDPAEDIKVFRADGTGYLFKSANTEPAASVVFSGELTVDDVEAGEELWAVYPFSDGATFDGEAITTVLPSDQVARPESFARNMNLSVARTTGNKLQFYNVGGGIRFSVTQEGIGKVIFEGLNGEILSGKVTIGFEEGVPVVKEVSGGSMFITLTPPEGETFQTGKWYYMVAIPGALEQGYKLRFYKGEDYAKKVSETPVTIKRAVFGSVADADKENEYEPTTTVFPETKEEWKESYKMTETISTEAGRVIERYRMSNGDDYTDAQRIADEISKLDNVVSAHVEQTGKQIYVQQSDGTSFHWILEWEGDFDEEYEDAQTKAFDDALSNKLLISRNSSIITPTGQKRALLLAPYYSGYKLKYWDRNKGKVVEIEKGKRSINGQYVSSLLNSAGYKLRFLKDEQVKVQHFWGDSLAKYDYIMILTHGGIDALCVGHYDFENDDFISNIDPSLLEHFSRNVFEAGTVELCVDKEWLERTTTVKYPNSIVYIGACHSYESGNYFHSYFHNQNAKAYSGFEGTVGNNIYYDYSIPRAILYSMCRSLCFGMSYKQALSHIHDYTDIWDKDFNRWVKNWSPYKYNNVYDDDLYLVNPHPFDLNKVVNNNIVTLSWKNPQTAGDYHYRVNVYGENVSEKWYEAQTSRGVTISDLEPGTYSWYVQADLYYDGELYESYTSDGEPFTIGPSGEAKIKVSKTSLVFDDTKVGQTSTLDWTITNVGDGTLEVSSITVPDGFSTDFSSWSSKSLEPTESHTFKVTFKPTEAKQYSGKMVFKSNAVNAQNQGFTIGGKGISSEGKPLKSMALSTNYPGAYFSDVSLDFKYDSKGRLSSVGNGMYTFSYSGNTMTFSDKGTAQLNSSGQFSSITWYQTTVTFKYDSNGRLSSINDSGMKINYKWSGSDLYSVTYSDGSTGMNPHFEPSSYLAPEKGVDINLMMRIFLNEIGFDGVLPDGNIFPMMASLIGKRSEHVLGLQVSQTATFDRVGNEGFSQYKGNDGKWHSLDYDTLYNWTEGSGSFEVKGSNVPYKLESKSWNWTADSSGAVTKGVWPLVQHIAQSVTGTMVVSKSSHDINGDGIVDSRDISISFKNGMVSGSSSKKNYSITFTFGY